MPEHNPLWIVPSGMLIEYSVLTDDEKQRFELTLADIHDIDRLNIESMRTSYNIEVERGPHPDDS
jgi:hypothetical protein